MRLGIDFGTTRTVVVAAYKGNFPLVRFEHSEDAAADFYPSVFAVSASGQVCCGWEALACAHEPDVLLYKRFKGVLGEVGATPARSLEIGGVIMSLGDWLTTFFLQLKDALIKGLPRKLKKGELLEAVVATPVRATSAYRLMLADAMRQAGFVVLGMVHEPAAAAVDYASRWASTLNSKRDRIVVYDLGGGTFDVADVDLNAETYVVRGYTGSERLGGEDFDAVLAQLALERLEVALEALSPRSVALLYDHCRQQKEALNVNSRQVLISVGAQLLPEELEALGVDEDVAVILKVSDYYERCQPLIDATLAQMAKVVRRLPDGEFDLEGVAGVYVVGGASCLPAVSRLLKQEFGRRLHRANEPSAATAMGLAMLAQSMEEGAGLEGRLKDVLGRYFGVYRELEGGRRVVMDVLLGPDAALPALGEEGLEVVRRYRPAHNIGVFRYVECTHLDERAEAAGHVAPLPEVRFIFDRELRKLHALEPKTPLSVRRSEGLGPVIEERYCVQPDGVIHVKIGDVELDQWCSYRLR